MDNDDGFWTCSLEDPAAAEAYQDELTEKYGRPKGYRDIVDIVNAAGVNCDWC